MSESNSEQRKPVPLDCALGTRWIDINTKQPQTGYVLVACDGGNIATTFFCDKAEFFDGMLDTVKLDRKTFGKWSKHFELARRFGYKITHWMPLPAPPKST